MVLIPGGGIIGGMGGVIYVDKMGTPPESFKNRGGAKAPTGQYLDVEGWRIARQWINAECPHTGTYGAITRRLVAYDWRFQGSMPYDQAKISPDDLLGVLPTTNSAWVNVALAFYLGDVALNPEAAAMELAQSFYYAPACMISSAQPVLNAARDVIRFELAGEGNSRLFLYPDEQTDCNSYIAYLQARGWLV